MSTTRGGPRSHEPGLGSSSVLLYSGWEEPTQKKGREARDDEVGERQRAGEGLPAGGLQAGPPGATRPVNSPFHMFFEQTCFFLFEQNAYAHHFPHSSSDRQWQNGECEWVEGGQGLFVDPDFLELVFVGMQRNRHVVRD